MAGKLGPEHEKAWSSKPLSVNKVLHILPSERNRHLDLFIKKLPNGFLRVSHFNEKCPVNSCVFGKAVNHTPIGKDRDSITIDLKDPSTDDIVKVILTGEALINFPKPISSLMYVYCGKPLVKNDRLHILCSNESEDLTIYMIDRWVYARLANTLSITNESAPPTKTTSKRSRPSTSKEGGSSKTVSSIAKPTLTTSITTSFSPSFPLETSKGPQKIIKIPSYNYCSLKELVIGSKSNVSGVVTFFKSPYRSRGTDYVTSFILVDPTQPSDGINIVSFHKDISCLPNVRRVGDVILLRRVEVNFYNGAPQILSKFFTSFHIFDGQSTDAPPYCSSQNATLSDSDKKEVERLKNWKSSLSHLNPKSCLRLLQDVQFGDKFNLIVYVVGVTPLITDTLFSLTVCDGSLPFENTTGVTLEPHPSSCERYLCNILVHASKIVLKPGQVAFLTDVMASSTICKDRVTGRDLCCVNLTLHCEELLSTMSYYVLQESDPDVIKLKDTIGKITALPPPPPPSPSPSLPSSITTITYHSTLNYSTLAQVKSSTVYPSKFRCLVQVVGINCHDVGQTVRQYCQGCSKRYPFSGDIKPSSVEINKLCVHCNKPLVTIFEFVLYIKDHTQEGTLPVLVSGDEAQRFLNGIHPTNLYTIRTTRDAILRLFSLLFKRDSPFDRETVPEQLSLMDCCICVVKVREGLISYRLCDTTVVS